MTSAEVFVANKERTEQDIHLELATDLERTLQVFLAETVDLTGKVFATCDDATEAGDIFRQDWSEEFAAINWQGFCPDIRATGENIVIPNTFLGRDIESGNLVIGLQNDRQAEVTEFYESAIGRLDNIYTSSGETEEGSGLYTNTVHMTLIKKAPKPFATSAEGFPVPLLFGTVSAHIFVPVSEHIAFEVPMRAELEKRAYMEGEIAKSGLQKSRLIDVINQVGVQLLETSPTSYKQLQNVERVQWLARQCVEYANNGTCSINVLTDKLLEVFRKGEYLKVSDESRMDEPLTGKIDDIYPHLDERGNPIKLYLAINTSNDPKKPEIESFALEGLTEIHY
jgi:hypothetical protein